MSSTTVIEFTMYLPEHWQIEIPGILATWCNAFNGKGVGISIQLSKMPLLKKVKIGTSSGTKVGILFLKHKNCKKFV